MKKLYLLFLFSFILVACSKDFLKVYEKRIVGSWYISDVNRIGIGGNSADLPFREGSFVFNSDHSLTYTDGQGNISNGSWDIQKRMIDDNTVRTFQITTVDFNSQRIRGEFYDDMNFRSTNHFVATINTPLRSFVTHFRR